MPHHIVCLAKPCTALGNYYGNDCSGSNFVVKILPKHVHNCSWLGWLKLPPRKHLNVVFVPNLLPEYKMPTNLALESKVEISLLNHWCWPAVVDNVWAFCHHLFWFLHEIYHSSTTLPRLKPNLNILAFKLLINIVCTLSFFILHSQKIENFFSFFFFMVSVFLNFGLIPKENFFHTHNTNLVI